MPIEALATGSLVIINLCWGNNMAHFSYSQMDTFIKCPEKYRFRYIEKIKMPANAELLRGDAYHKGVAFGYTGVLAYHKYPSLEETLQVYSDAWDKRAKEQIINEDDAELTVPAITFGDKISLVK